MLNCYWIKNVIIQKSEYSKSTRETLSDCAKLNGGL